MYICLGSISISPTGVTVSLRVLVPWDWIGMNWIGSGFGSSGGIGGSGSTAGSVAFICCHYNSPMYVWHVSRAMYVRMYVRWYASFRASFLLGFAPCHPNHPTTASTPLPTSTSLHSTWRRKSQGLLQQSQKTRMRLRPRQRLDSIRIESI